ncbi:GMC family oxidoreductase [Actinacidiphila guanduensis]|uniref:Choline dehydrogenase n=1 Tax=Actinacidiphila guanduensis TaxID=310781 RepID=A0A1G9W2B8_9ACTN|nr:GMC family oxidoreductase N-terminal domain-containing protein [Actinacidiphila guanduensis]SDM78650.1 Choline dehydrogenase [Actinacidiphila guanduensis]
MSLPDTQTTPASHGTTEAPFDHIVVGGGAAGSVLAARLSADPGCRVLLLEAGPADTDPRIAPPHGPFAGLLRGDHDWSYDTAPQEQLGGRTVPLSAGRVLGGGGSINYQAWYRGHRLDYDGWAERGMKGWSFEEVLPAFRRSEDHELGSSRFHGTGGPIPVTTPKDVSPLSLAFIAAGVEAGLPLNRDFNGAELDGVGLLYSNVREGERYSAARGYLRPAEGRPNLVVRTGALVRRVLLTGTRATGVEYSDPTGTHRVHADSVVLSAGAIRTPQLLMLSGIGPADELARHGIDVVQHLPGVGAHLQDHPSALIGWPVHRGETWLDARNEHHEALYAQQRRGLQASMGQAGAFLRCAEGAEAPDIELTPMLIDLLGNSMPGISCLVTVLTPESRGSVRLASTDPAAAPVIDPRYYSDSADRRLVVEGLRRTLEIADSPILRALIGPASFPAATDDASLLESARTSTISTNHPVGTCRAGLDEESVVDPALRVHGITGLRVVDASVMPALPRGNTHAPSVMIGERAAELITAP